MPDISPGYRSHGPQSSQYYQCVEDHFEMLEQTYHDRFSNRSAFSVPM